MNNITLKMAGLLAETFAEYNQQEATFHNLFIYLFLGALQK